MSVFEYNIGDYVVDKRVHGALLQVESAMHFFGVINVTVVIQPEGYPTFWNQNTSGRMSIELTHLRRASPLELLAAQAE